MACLSDSRFTEHLPFKIVFAAPRGDRKKQFVLYAHGSTDEVDGV